MNWHPVTLFGKTGESAIRRGMIYLVVAGVLTTTILFSSIIKMTIMRAKLPYN